MAFWNREVANEALLFVAQARRQGELVSTGAALELNRRGVSAEQVAAEAGYGRSSAARSRGGAIGGARARALGR
eukprot:5317404-Alexandrium_andersonii.AAC.1